MGAVEIRVSLTLSLNRRLEEDKSLGSAPAQSVSDCWNSTDCLNACVYWSHELWPVEEMTEDLAMGSACAVGLNGCKECNKLDHFVSLTTY